MTSNGKNPNINDYTHDDIFKNLISKNHTRLLITSIVLMLIANASAVSLLLSGTASKHLTWSAIITEFAIIIPIIAAIFIITRRMKGHPLSSYVAIIGTGMFLFVFQYFIFGSTELSATHYIILIFSVFYFNERVSLVAFIVVIASQLALFALRPELIPSGPKSGIAVKFILYVSVGIGAYMGSKASRELLLLAIQKAAESQASLAGLSEMARNVDVAVVSLKEHADNQALIALDVSDLSHRQSSSLEEISASLEELTGNSESITNTAKSLSTEMGLASESVDDLSKVYDLIQSSASVIAGSIGQITKNSRDTFNQIKTIMERFNILGDKGTDISNFIQVINDIADKVNLLSLNASIEAARAGDFGRGFAVVADEISKLADATTQNASEIEKLIRENRELLEGSRDFIDAFSKTVGELNSSISNITREIAKVGDMITDIGNTVKVITHMGNKIFESSKAIEISTNEQQIATEESSKSVQYVHEASQKLVSVAVSIKESTDEVNRLAQTLRDMTGRMVGGEQS